MPVARDDLADLRGLLYFLENSDKHRDAVTRRKQVDALRRAIRLLESGDPASPLWWAAGALTSALRKAGPNMYVTVDRALETWALDQIFDLMANENPDARH